MTRFSPTAAQLSDGPADSQRLASWYTPGLSDAIGDRLLMFDNTTSSSLEMLRFRPELWKHPGFEEALRRRIEELADFDHPSIAKVRAVESLGGEEGLALISNHTIGRRLSEIRTQAHGPQFASELVRQILPIVAALQEQGNGLSHGLLTPERVVVTPEGQLVLTEHVLAPAIDALGRSSEALCSELGVVVPSGSGKVSDPRADVVQLGYLALSLLLGRRLDSLDTARYIVGSLSTLVLGTVHETPEHLQQWLVRALQVRQPFKSASEAQTALRSWPELDVVPDQIPGASAPKVIPAAASTPLPIVLDTFSDADVETPIRTSAPDDALEAFDLDDLSLESAPRQWPQPVEALGLRRLAEGPRSEEPDLQALDRGEEVTHEAPVVSFPYQEAVAPIPPPTSRWLVPGLVFVCVAEAAVIAVLWAAWPAASPGATVALQTPSVARPVVERSASPPPAAAPAPPAAATFGRLEISSEPSGARVTIDGKAAGTTPLTTTVEAGSHAVVVGSGDATTRRTINVSAGSTATLMATLTPTGSTGGWLTIDTPLDLQVYEDTTLIGTTKARLMLPSGRHELRLASQALGFERSIMVDVPAGRTVTARVEPPDGTISLNALPWAEVSFDGQALGTTPFANLTVPIGVHEVVWRHPQLGERRQTVLVTAKAPVRLVVDLRQ